MQTHSIYIHIPFCVHRCAYCDFNTYAGLDELIPAYIQALCQEISQVGTAAQAFFQGQRAAAHTVFFGGGTPSLIPLAEMERVFQALHRSFQLLPDAEISLEANPGTLTPEYLHGLRTIGINRLSLGMQSANPADLTILERQHDLGDVINAVNWAREAGFSNLNLDLIFGIPYQSLQSWQNTLAMALSLKPDHLSLYALTLEHGTPMEHWVGRGLLPEQDNDLAADMYEVAMQRLEQAGFGHYEISNWARRNEAGDLMTCRHNLQYWRTLPYLGFGAGAHGFSSGFRTVNVLAPAAYIKHLETPLQTFISFPQSPATTEMLPIDRQTEKGEMMMMGLRLVQEGVKDAEFTQRFGESLEQAYGRQIVHLQRQGLLEWWDRDGTGRALRLTRPGRLLGNRVFREFI